MSSVGQTSKKNALALQREQERRNIEAARQEQQNKALAEKAEQVQIQGGANPLRRDHTTHEAKRKG
jgi:hypothetical protein